VAKKKVGPKEEDSKLEDVEEDIFDKEDIDSHYPDVSNESVKKDETPLAETPEQTEKVESEEEEEEVEQAPELPEHTILKLDIISGPGDNDYTLTLEGQSHGFCNILVKHLLMVEGVIVAAYKITEIALSPPQIFIRLEDGYKLKKIFLNGIDALRNEVAEAQKLFKKLM